MVLYGLQGGVVIYEPVNRTARPARFSTIISKDPSGWFLVFPFRNLAAGFRVYGLGLQGLRV